MTIDTESSSSIPLAWIAGVGASAGLGAAVGRRFARSGFAVVLTGRTHERVAAVADEIRAQGGIAHVASGDIASEADVERLAVEVRTLGTLRAAVFNAGNAVRAPTLELSAAQFENAWRTNVIGGFLFAKATLAQLLDASDDAPRSLLFTGATASLRGRPPFAAFASAKAGLRSLAQTLAREFGPRGIHVAHAVIDGGIDGERLRGAAPDRAAQAGADGLLSPDAIAESYWQLHVQHRSAWTQELDLRPYNEAF
ncbi:SDR family NAD(P)-dependent oxidoreductase [Burkholderia oklahomensis]|uniref:SDR family NAD(P)-dependent oxidoreductase n=1 Tax=Burkholderia oklahomensis TaxID=342113 RepID=UPI00016A910C|nr:SDR family NAD(P)-dependent oxidoreductase [Burkholderia oklahomensis]AJX34002.1 short chain dehydrogenase family protein [Burkholderia oklahomensis C6786]AOI49219.1 glucose 1-dehydrogenase [Burkholderia oklahomensis C6786]KUY60733.1 glucose 1-dehydrogenase [Burkholderia oklahomensis C6786]MBI0362541.1 SDR family NAD(P)-dependent oxidoreductase [Burkholderia oklahomensis]SUY26649.1 Glucose 1-dehydrogenase [Burkholderia oklahomensis]